MRFTQEQVDAYELRQRVATEQRTARQHNALLTGESEVLPVVNAPRAVAEPPVCNEYVGAVTGKEGDTAGFLVRIESFRVRLTDPDNLCPKYWIDCARYAGLIPDDSASHIKVQVTQTKVKTFAEEGTRLTITPI